MSISIHSGEAAASGRLEAAHRSPTSGTDWSVAPGALARNVSSEEINQIFDEERRNGRKVWARLAVQLDQIELVFWHPAELRVYCDTFAMTPFPTARSLVGRDDTETRLNRHWLSRLPKEAKSPKFRKRFLDYVKSSPEELREFCRFYGA